MVVSENDDDSALVVVWELKNSRRVFAASGVVENAIDWRLLSRRRRMRRSVVVSAEIMVVVVQSPFFICASLSVRSTKHRARCDVHTEWRERVKTEVPGGDQTQPHFFFFRHKGKHLLSTTGERRKVVERTQSAGVVSSPPPS